MKGFFLRIKWLITGKYPGLRQPVDFDGRPIEFYKPYKNMGQRIPDPDIPELADKNTQMNGSRGLGDTIAKATSAMGIKPCEKCKKRQEALNRVVPYGNHNESDSTTTDNDSHQTTVQ